MKQFNRDHFFKRAIYPSRRISEEVLTNLATKSFEELLVSFAEDARLEKFLKNGREYEEYFFAIFKNIYLEQLSKSLLEANQEPETSKDFLHPVTSGNTFLLPGYSISVRAAVVLEQLSQTGKDYFIWRYLDKFSIAQISNITGESLDLVKTTMWNCYLDFKKLWNQGDPGMITEEQFFCLVSYFENKLTAENERSLIRQLNDNIIFQEDFELEVILYRGINKSVLLERITKRNDEPFASADEFIDRAKQIIESSSKKT